MPATCGSAVKTRSQLRAFSGVGTASACDSALSWSGRERGVNPNGEAAVELVWPEGLDAVGSDARSASVASATSATIARERPRVFQSRLINRPFSGIRCLTEATSQEETQCARCDSTVQSIAEGEDWLAAGMLVTERAIPKPHPRYVASAAVDRGMSAIGPRVFPTGKISPKSKLVCNPSASAESPSLRCSQSETHVHW